MLRPNAEDRDEDNSIKSYGKNSPNTNDGRTGHAGQDGLTYTQIKRTPAIVDQSTADHPKQSRAGFSQYGEVMSVKNQMGLSMQKAVVRQSELGKQSSIYDDAVMDMKSTILAKEQRAFVDLGHKSRETVNAMMPQNI